MGSSTSKAAKTASKISATNSAARKYPTRPPPPSSNTANAQPQPRPVQRSPEGRVGPGVHPAPQASTSRDQAINLDSSDPHLSSPSHSQPETKNPTLDARLRDIGPVEPNPSSPPLPQSTQFQPSPSTLSQTIFPPSPTSTHTNQNPKQNPALSLLTARYRLAEEAEKEFSEIGRKGANGRRFLDVVTLRQVLVLRDEKGMSGREIEEALGLKKGVVGELGGRGRVVGVGY